MPLSEADQLVLQAGAMGQGEGAVEQLRGMAARY